MIQPTRRDMLVALACLALGTRSAAAPTRYALDRAASTVGFRFILNGVSQTGSMPVQRADIFIDPANLAASRVDVTLDVAGARTPLGFATQALLSPEVLDAARFPTIRFVSKTILLSRDGRLSGGARIRGHLTLRGVTRPITLNAGLYRPRGTRADDLDILTVRLSGQLSRTAYGAAGYPRLVGDRVTLDITALIRVAG
ncbi:YceI family protein [Sedimentitalea sp. HM32M-2]|uniref:YceI family protein n=1 Tax=Sedimentitalea sp. HM32M-2 TaxID=3351566 RepID=UPI00362E0356